MLTLINRDARAKSVYRGTLLVVFMWLFLLVASLFAFNDPTVVLLFPIFPVGTVLSMVVVLWDSGADPTILGVLKIASAATLASLAGYAWIRQSRMSLYVLLLLTVVALAITGLLAFSSMPLSNDAVVLLPPAIACGMVLLMSTIALSLGYICRQRGAMSVGMEVTTFVFTLCLLSVAWYWRHPLVNYVGEFSEGVAHAEVNGRWGYVDLQGRFVIRPQFYDARGFSEGLAEVSPDCGEGQESCRGYINKKGTIVFSIPAERATQFREGLAAVKMKGKYGYVNTRESFEISPRFDDAFPFSEALALVISEGLRGYINRSGDQVIPFLFVQAQSFSEGLATAQVKADQRGVASKFGYR